MFKISHTIRETIEISKEQLVKLIADVRCFEDPYEIVVYYTPNPKNGIMHKLASIPMEKYTGPFIFESELREWAVNNLPENFRLNLDYKFVVQ